MKAVTYSEYAPDDNNQIKKVQTDQGDFEADEVVFAAGICSPKL